MKKVFAIAIALLGLAGATTAYLASNQKTQSTTSNNVATATVPASVDAVAAAAAQVPEFAPGGVSPTATADRHTDGTGDAPESASILAAQNSPSEESPSVAVSAETAERTEPSRLTHSKIAHADRNARHATKGERIPASDASGESSAGVSSDASETQAAKPPRPQPIYVVPEAPLKAANEHDERAGIQIYLGIGMNYVQYDEALSDVGTGYRDLRGPTVNVGVKMDATETLGFEASYHNTPIKFENTSVGLQSLESTWTTVSLEASLKSRPHSHHKIKDEDSEGDNDLAYLFGFQLHQMPLAMFETTSHLPRLRDIQLFNISAGARDTYYLNRKTRTSLLGRIQIPLNASAKSGATSFTTSSAYMFDGSVSLEKRVSRAAWLGLFWYGQYQNLGFSYKDSVINTSGTQKAIFSDLELRLTFDF